MLHLNLSKTLRVWRRNKNYEFRNDTVTIIIKACFVLATVVIVESRANPDAMTIFFSVQAAMCWQINFYHTKFLLHVYVSIELWRMSCLILSFI